MAEVLHNKLTGALGEGGVGLWPITESNEQRLNVFTKENNTIKKNYLISTLFSEQRKPVSEATQKYFVEYDNILNEPYEPPAPAPIRNVVNPKVVEKSATLKRATSLFKLWQEEFKKEHGRAPTLEEIRKSPQGSQLLNDLGKK